MCEWVNYDSIVLHTATLLSLWVSLQINSARGLISCGSFAFPNDNVATGNRQLPLRAELPGSSDLSFRLGRALADVFLFDDDSMFLKNDNFITMYL